MPPSAGRATSGGSAEAVIAPQRDQVTLQILAEGDYLSRTLPSGLLREGANLIRLRDPVRSASRIGMTALGVGAVGAGFAFELVRGKIGRR